MDNSGQLLLKILWNNLNFFQINIKKLKNSHWGNISCIVIFYLILKNKYKKIKFIINSRCNITCDSSCLTCDGPGPMNCLSCDPNSYL